MSVKTLKTTWVVFLGLLQISAPCLIVRCPVLATCQSVASVVKCLAVVQMICLNHLTAAQWMGNRTGVKCAMVRSLRAPLCNCKAVIFTLKLFLQLGMNASKS